MSRVLHGVINANQESLFKNVIYSLADEHGDKYQVQSQTDEFTNHFLEPELSAS